MSVINNPVASKLSGLGGKLEGVMEGLGEGSGPLSALSEGGSGGMGGTAATLIDPLGALGNAIFGDSPIKYFLMPHLLLTDALSGGLSGGSSGSSSGIATLLSGASAS